jgi:GT2 family glycosyltransferase
VNARGQDGKTAFEPVRLLEVELTEALPSVPARTEGGGWHPRARSLVRLHGRALGVVELALGPRGLTPAAHAAHVWSSLRREITSHLALDGLPPVTALPAHGLASASVPRCVEERRELRERAPFVSVVVATRDRAEALSRCLASLLELDYGAHEIIVVDNAPATEAARVLVAERYGDCSRLRYVREDVPGLAAAHNRGLRESRGALVAFTDDDVVVDRLWLLELVRCFELGDEVGCVTGMIYPAELETPAQLWADGYWRLGKGFSERRFDLDEHRPSSPLFPYAIGALGSGANMAFKREALRDIDGFDRAIGAGTPARGGDDLTAFFELITRGWALVYSPTAIVKHWHARGFESLRRQAYGYGMGLTAYLTGAAIRRPGRLTGLAARVPRGVAYALSSSSAKNAAKPHDYPAELTRLERRGMLVGPPAYLWSRWRARRSDYSGRS